MTAPGPHPKDNPLRDFFVLVFSVVCWILMVVITVFLSVSAMIFVLPLSALVEGKSRHMMHRISRLWARTILAATPFWKLRIEGDENLDCSKTYIVVANHQSILDILAVLAGIRTHFKFLAKKELFSIPFLGWHLSLAGYIPLNRGSKESARDAVGQARDYVRRGISILLFPEGTRSLDGQVQPFKAGAFKIAAEEKVEILPVAIDGTGQAIPKHSFRMKPGTMLTLKIGKSFRIPSDDHEAIEAARESTRMLIAAQLRTLRETVHARR